MGKITENFPEWAVIAYRGVRAAVGAGLAQALILQPDWSDSEQAFRAFAVAFGTGFLVAMGKWARELLDKYFDQDEKSLVAKTMVI